MKTKWPLSGLTTQEVQAKRELDCCNKRNWFSTLENGLLIILRPLCDVCFSDLFAEIWDMIKSVWFCSVTALIFGYWFGQNLSTKVP